MIRLNWTFFEEMEWKFYNNKQYYNSLHGGYVSVQEEES